MPATDHVLLRSTSRRLILELALLIIAVGFPVKVASGSSAGQAWGFILRHPTLVLHVALAVVTLVEAVAFVMRAWRRSGRSARLISAAILAFLLLANGGGVAFASAGAHESMLNYMTVGWLGAAAFAGYGWWRGHHMITLGRTPPSTATRG